MAPKRSLASEFEIERVGTAIASRITGIPIRTLQNLALEGQVPGAAKPAGRWTFDINLLRHWCRSPTQKVESWQKISMSETEYTGRASRSPVKNIDALYESVLNQRRAQKQGLARL
jgi:hypothetical protein